MNAKETERGGEESRVIRGRFLVIGYGNVLRGDDGAGAWVVEALDVLALPGLETRMQHQLTPELALDWRPEDTVIFVDAVAAAEGGGTELKAVPLVREGKKQIAVDLGWSGHRCSPEALLEWAWAMGGVTVRSWVLAVPGCRFDWGLELSPMASEGVAGAVDVIQNLWEAWRTRAGPFSPTAGV